MSDSLVFLPGPDRRDDLRRRLDRWAEEVGEPGWAWSVWPELGRILTHLRRRLPAAEWTGLRDWLRGQEIAALALEDPFTRWAWDRPRGIEGDAVLTDFALRHPAMAGPLRAATPLGRDIHAAMAGTALAVGIREGPGIFARIAENVIARVSAPAFLTLGAGHLREREALPDPAAPALWVAMDRDALALAALRRQGHPGVEPVLSTPSRFGAAVRRAGRFDLIHLPGILDALEEGAARRLVAACFAALQPGGVLLLGCAAAGAPDAGYMDALMDWRPVTRDMARVAALLDGLPGRACAAKRVFAGGNGTRLHALARRRG